MGAFLLFFAIISLEYFGIKRLLRHLLYFQQEEYSALRFWRWLLKNRVFDRKGSLVSLSSGAICLLAPEPVSILTSILASLALAIIAFKEEDPRHIGKIRLNMTSRAKRIFFLAIVLMNVILLGIVALSFSDGMLATGVFWFLCALLIQLTPVYPVLSTSLLAPQERRLQDRFKREAQALLKETRPFIIGITGSYGKTSTKSILADMLQGLGPTLWPRGSVNTVMGITRYIRENLEPFYKFAIFEMGAYGEGSIKRLCDFVEPRAGIITAIGMMHLERFGSREAIFRAKSELAAAIPPRGILVLNGDDDMCRRVAHEYHQTRKVLLYGMSERALDFRMSNIHISESGTSFDICWGGHQIRGQTKLLGRPNLYNILGAFAMACAVGVDPEYSIAAARNLVPTKNRLQLTKEGDISFLNDAYNSNPVGFRAALEVLASLPAGRRILVTPGMIELGDQQFEENRLVAAEAAAICDMVFLVGTTNREALITGIRSRPDGKAELKVFDDRDSALSYLKTMLISGDVVLLENDLPDLYERLPRL